jgi:hypothetical protein
VPVDARAGDTEEEVAGLDAARVIRELGHVCLGSVSDDLDRRERGGQPLEIHRE